MSAADDARARREAWEQAGSPDYNNGGAPTAPVGSEYNPYPAGTTFDSAPPPGVKRYTTVIPTVSAPVVPTVTPTSGRTTSSDGTQTYFGPNAPSVAPAAPAAPAVPTKVAGVDPRTGLPAEYTPEEWVQIRADWDKAAAEQKRQTGVAETQAQFALDTARAAQVANEAYNNAMMQYNNAQLAQAAADNAMRNDIAQQQAETAKAQQASESAYQQGTLANQRAQQVNESAYQQGTLANQSAAQASDVQYKQQLIAQQGLATQQDRRKRRPYRPLRVSVA